MGCEYTIKFSKPDIKEVQALLKTLPYFQKIILQQGTNQYLFRTPENTGPLPSGLAEIHPSGIYFCDYGEGQEVLKEMIFRLALNYKNLEVIDHNE